MTNARNEHPLAPIWPPARLRVVTPRLELRLPTSDERDQLVDAALEGIHDLATMPFAAPWSDAPPDVIGRELHKWHLSRVAAWQEECWTLLFGVFVDGHIVGCQDLGATQFAIARHVSSGSWLAKSVQGAGLGTEMRQAVLHLSFEGLGAHTAASSAYEDNIASQRVSARCGYQPNGTATVVRSRGALAPTGPAKAAAAELHFRLTRERWLERRRHDIELLGLDDELLQMCGAASATSESVSVANAD